MRSKIYSIYGEQLQKVKELIESGEIKQRPYSYEEDVANLQRILDHWDTLSHDKNTLFKLNESLSIRLDLIKKDELWDSKDAASDMQQLGHIKALIVLIQDKIKEKSNKI